MSESELDLMPEPVKAPAVRHGQLGDEKPPRYIASDGNLLAENDPVGRGAIQMPSFCAVSANIMYDMNFDGMLSSFGYSGGSIAAEWFNDATYAISIFYITITCLSMVYCMMMLLVLGEMNKEELRDYVRLMGTKMNQGFLLFFIGLTSLALHVGATVFLGTKTWGGRMFALCFCGIPVGFVVMMSLTPMIHNLYKVKLERAKLGPADHGPCALDAAELRQQLAEFLKVINPELLSAENFSQWVKEQNARRRGFSACLASLTQKRLDRIVEEHHEERLREEGLGNE